MWWTNSLGLEVGICIGRARVLAGRIASPIDEASSPPDVSHLQMSEGRPGVDT
jgi:hypothetical protein